MKVLAITSLFPLPLDSGGPVRFLGLARALAAEHDVHMLAIRRPDTTPRLVSQVESAIGGAVELFDRPAPRKGPQAIVGRWVRATAVGIPPWIAEVFSPELERRAAALAPDVDAVVILDEYAGIYANRRVSDTPLICDKSNVMGWSAAAGDRPAGAGERLHRLLAIHLSRRFERRYIRHAAEVVVTSAEEGRRLQSLYGRAEFAVVPSAVDLPDEPVEVSAAPTIGWLGSLEYSANVHGLLRFAEEAWEPLGREGAQLLIAGRAPPPSVQALERLPGVRVLDYVEDLGGFFARLGAAVVPLWQGAGVKLKTLAFMGAGVPVAGTPVAVEGIEVEDGRHCLIADDPAGLASALRSILADRDNSRRMGAEARSLIAEGYTWRTIGPQFTKVVDGPRSGCQGENQHRGAHQAAPSRPLPLPRRARGAEPPSGRGPGGGPPR